ncbi:EscC/YscC/HrcC family type III secretion system outer membrane ring protein [Erwinia sp. E602]|uniref:type III secretion system outer membrane ring subunit SctC n=1 Tax=Erwinia sp. E602 TaxID=2675378 RepID=UPI001BA6517F|nr:type III secretion system outer membrane ring subunit SctC [Erwinia sp. E602]QUG74582.1 EscC/YscC/HrcC family type III secretion system outer membrane ring protein [Erwinia sp. E602]
MISTVFKKNRCCLIILLAGALNSTWASAGLLEKKESGSSQYNESGVGADSDNTYVASNNSIRQLFYVIGGALGKPVIVSNEAAKKRVSGNFDLNRSKEALSKLASRTGLIWYDDGSSVYIYDSSEIQSKVVRLMYAPFDRLVAYLQSSGLYDSRFPLRSNGTSGSFYVSGPPVYVELIGAAAKHIDTTYSRTGTGESTIRVIKLRNTFVTDRTFTQRDAPVTIPGVAAVLNKLLNNSSSSAGSAGIAGAQITVDRETQSALQAAEAGEEGRFPALPALSSSASHQSFGDRDNVQADTVTIVAYSDTNSLLIKGSARQVSFVEDLVRAIDVAKKQIQLSLWIIDISKDAVDKLGVQWQGAATIGGNGVTLNQSTLAPASSAHFLADVTALAQKGNAQIVSRPEILTQENVPALFDNNHSFYAKLQGERNSSLEKVTYGTMISVLPRLTQYQQEVEMILNIQDGGTQIGANGETNSVDNLPVVSNTQISTEARVPAGYGLLVGGYGRDEDTQNNIGIPLLRDIPLLGKLFDYSYVSRKKMVRMFLIQPRLLINGQPWQGLDDENPVLGREPNGNEVRLKSTVSMLRETMNSNQSRAR